MNIHILLNYIDLSRQATANLHIHWPRISLKLVVTCVINWQAGTKLIRHGEERDGFVTPNMAAIKKRYDGFKGISGLPLPLGVVQLQKVTSSCQPWTPPPKKINTYKIILSIYRRFSESTNFCSEERWLRPVAMMLGYVKNRQHVLTRWGGPMALWEKPK